MGFSNLRRPYTSSFAGSGYRQPAPTGLNGGPGAPPGTTSGYNSAGNAMMFAPGAAPSPAVKPGKGTQPLPTFLDAPSEQTVSTDRKQNFQRSLNLERANTAVSAAVFAQNAPLPMKASPDLEQYGRGGRPPDGTEATVYSGAFGNGPQAQQTAEAARAATIARQLTTANAQNFGTGQNAIEYQGLRNDWNERENQDAQTRADAPPDAKTVLQESQAARNNVYANTIAPTIADKNVAATEQAKVKTNVITDAAPANLDKTKSQTAVNAARAKAIPQGTDTATNRENRIANNPPGALRAANANANDVVTMARKEHDLAAKSLNEIDQQLNALPSVNSPIIARQKAELQALRATRQAELDTAKQKYERVVGEAAAQRSKASKPSAGQVLGGPAPQTIQGGEPVYPPMTGRATRSLTTEDAQAILQEAGGDKDKARQIALSRGYSF